MSGHSKWSTIKRQKQATDKKRGQVFTKLAMAIILAVRDGGGITDPENNVRLRLAVDRAKAANMPKSNIDRAVARGSGKLGAGEQLHEIVYEGFGPDGVGILVQVVTDNKNRTQSELRNVFNRGGGTIAGVGAVSHLFDPVGIITIKKTHSFDDVFEQALEAGVLDVEQGDEEFFVYTTRTNLHSAKEQLQNAGLTISDAVTGYRPKTATSVESHTEQKIVALLEALEDLDDVQDVFTNADFSS